MKKNCRESVWRTCSYTYAYQRKHILLFELVEYFRELARVKDFVYVNYIYKICHPEFFMLSNETIFLILTQLSAKKGIHNLAHFHLRL